jgi:hypothetical protein
MSGRAESRYIHGWQGSKRPQRQTTQAFMELRLPVSAQGQVRLSLARQSQRDKPNPAPSVVPVLVKASSLFEDKTSFAIGLNSYDAQNGKRGLRLKAADSCGTM